MVSMDRNSPFKSQINKYIEKCNIMEPEVIRDQRCPLDMLTGIVNHVTAPSSDVLVFERSSSNDCNLH
jgi:hypothetical protein